MQVQVDYLELKKKKRIFINMTQHPLLPEQKKLAVETWGVEEFYDFKDIGAVSMIIPPDALPMEVYHIANDLKEKIDRFTAEKDAGLVVIHLGGELSLMYYLISAIHKGDFKHFAMYIPVVSCTERIVEEKQLPDGSVQKISKFVFKGFREITNFDP
ncbi:MAG: hypothetical protein B6U95_00035 [Thermofilum sp. ex4484_82]|nr:MAG: hypothetical protein B6U95_00035 [Thermofilum sp. ex4484_82]OYT40118.1 MAG: hypothetical protein B6U96_00035 [Archaeoglobales archaeon ex4484_92]